VYQKITTMAYQFNGFRATKPVVRLIDELHFVYEVFFIVYDPDGKKHYFRYKKGINSMICCLYLFFTARA